jgi:hypothetical protein
MVDREMAIIAQPQRLISGLLTTINFGNAPVTTGGFKLIYANLD